MKAPFVACRSTALALVVLAALIAAPATAGANWSGVVELTNSGERDGEQLVIDANLAGDLVAAWRESGTADIAAVFKGAAAAAGAPQKFAGDFEEPDVAIGPGSVAVLAFDDDSGYGSVYAASKAAAASTFTGTVAFIGDGHPPPNDAPPSAAEPRVAVNGFGTGMLFFGRDYYNPPSYSDIAEAIEGRVLLDPSANTWNSGADLNLAVPDPRDMEVSVGPDGSAFLGINHFEQGPFWGISTAVLENGGTGSSNPGHLGWSGTDTYRGVYPSNARLPNNDVVMAWGHSGNGSVRFLDLPKARALAGSTNLTAQEERLDAGDGSQTTSGAVRVRTDAAGNTIVVWHATGGAEEAILARVRPAGGSFGPVEVIDSGEDYMAASRELDFDVDDAGSGYLVYSQENAANGNDEIMAVVRRPDGAWSNPELLSVHQGIAGSPTVAAADGGRAYAAWIANGDDGVYYATFQAPACDDGVDNDGDGLIDHPDDPGCSSPTDDDESDPPPESGGGEPQGSSPPADPGGPKLAKTVNTAPVKGKVRIRIPGTKRFRVLRAGEQIPVGSLVDTTRGRVRLTTATPGGGTQSAVFYQGLFKVTQRARGGLTELRVLGPHRATAARSGGRATDVRGRLAASRRLAGAPVVAAARSAADAAPPASGARARAASAQEVATGRRRFAARSGSPQNAATAPCSRSGAAPSRCATSAVSARWRCGPGGGIWRGDDSRSAPAEDAPARTARGRRSLGCAGVARVLHQPVAVPGAGQRRRALLHPRDAAQSRRPCRGGDRRRQLR